MNEDPMSAEDFLEALDDHEQWTNSDLVTAFGFYLHEHQKQDVFSPSQVNKCFKECHLPVPTWTRVQLNKRSSGPTRGTNNQIYIKTDGGYKLTRAARKAIRGQSGLNTSTIKTTNLLSDLGAKLADADERAFLEEAIICFQNGARRATVVMVWILTMDHLYRYVLAKKHVEFVAAMKKQSDKKLHSLQLYKPEDFTEMKESKFIEIARSAKIISNDVRKILDEKLGVRNSAGHPSGITISQKKVEVFVEDLVDNVILKYSI